MAKTDSRVVAIAPKLYAALHETGRAKCAGAFPAGIRAEYEA